MQRRFPILALVVFPLILAGCEKNAATPPPPAAPAPVAAAAPKAAGATRTIGFELTGTQAVGALQFDVKYTGEGRFVGDNDAVACDPPKIEGALSTFNHIVADKNLRAAFAAVKGFTGPVRITACKFQGDAKVEDFTVTVRDSSDPDLKEISPPPVIKVVLD